LINITIYCCEHVLWLLLILHASLLWSHVFTPWMSSCWLLCCYYHLLINVILVRIRIAQILIVFWKCLLGFELLLGNAVFQDLYFLKINWLLLLYLHFLLMLSWIKLFELTNFPIIQLRAITLNFFQYFEIIFFSIHYPAPPLNYLMVCSLVYIYIAYHIHILSNMVLYIVNTFVLMKSTTQWITITLIRNLMLIVWRLRQRTYSEDGCTRFGKINSVW
jgi:hypothetical protein